MKITEDIPRKQFRELLERLKNPPGNGRLQTLQEQMHVALFAELKKRHPRAKQSEYNITKYLPQEVREEIRKPFLDEAGEIHEAWAEEKPRLQDKLQEAAIGIALPTTDTRQLYDSIYPGAWRSAGPKYAEMFAGLIAAELEHFGVKAEIVDEMGTFRVYVYLSEEDTDILKIQLKNRSMPLRDKLKFCWGNGVNPRVYFPHLPHGVEKELGIDFFGKDLPKKGES